jgi:hypothetical protein
LRPVVYVSPFVPADWIAAHGLLPRRIVPGARGGGDARPGACPFVEDARESGLDVFTTTCDQARRSAEEAPDAFLLNVPHTTTLASIRLFREELERLSRWLVARGGERPDDGKLVRVLTEYDDGRRALLQARGLLTGRAWAREAVAHFARGRPAFTPGEADESRAGIPVALVGGPVWGPHDAIYELIESAGGEVVLDGTETGERGIAAPYDRRRLGEDPMGELVDAWFGAIPDAFRRPNTELYRWLERGFAKRGVRGVVFVRCVWCDLWHAELERLREWSDLPVADVDLTGESGSLGRAETRIQALLDAIR